VNDLPLRIVKALDLFGRTYGVGRSYDLDEYGLPILDGDALPRMCAIVATCSTRPRRAASAATPTAPNPTRSTNMRLTTVQTLCNEVAGRHRFQYAHRMHTPLFDGKLPVDIQAQLVALGPTPTKADVDRVMGNESWTRLRCNGCGQDVDAAAFITDDDLACRACLTRALSLFPETP